MKISLQIYFYFSFLADINSHEFASIRHEMIDWKNSGKFISIQIKFDKIDR